MNEHEILIAASGLRDFPAAAVAAYTGSSEDDVTGVLSRYPGVFEQHAPSRRAHEAAPRWRVTDADRLQELLDAGGAADEPADQPAPPRFDLIDTRLGQAEADLLSLPHEHDPGTRRLMARTAYNFLLQSATELQGDGDGTWWSLRPDGGRLPARMRLTLALAQLTLSQLEHDPERSTVTHGRLPEILDDVLSYVATVASPEDRQLFTRLRALIRDLVVLDADDAADSGDAAAIELPGTRPGPPHRTLRLPRQRRTETDAH
jgi:hypothetical protein